MAVHLGANPVNQQSVTAFSPAHNEKVVLFPSTLRALSFLVPNMRKKCFSDMF